MRPEDVVPVNLDSNSNSKRTTRREEPKERRKLDRVTTSDVIKRREPLGKRLASAFTTADLQSVTSYIVMDVLIPSAKNTISDMVSEGIERFLFGESRGRGSKSYYTPRISYNRPTTSYDRVSRDRDDRHRELSYRGRATHNFDEIILQNRGEAEEVIDSLFDLLNQFDCATVADLYDLVGVTSKFTDNKWGWTNLEGAKVLRVRQGYLLDLPRPEPLDR